MAWARAPLNDHRRNSTQGAMKLPKTNSPGNEKGPQPPRSRWNPTGRTKQAATPEETQTLRRWNPEPRDITPR
jgi:hypothetical protein